MSFILLQAMMALPIVLPLIFGIGFIATSLLLVTYYLAAVAVNAISQRKLFPTSSRRTAVVACLIGGALFCSYFIYRLSTQPLIN